MSPPDPRDRLRLRLPAFEQATIQTEEALGPSAPKDDAIREARQLSRDKTEDELRAEALRKEHGRNERFRDHWEGIVVCIMYIVAAIGVALFAVWILHLAGPEWAGWLKSERISQLQAVVIGGVVGAALAHARKRLGQ